MFPNTAFSRDLGVVLYMCLPINAAKTLFLVFVDPQGTGFSAESQREKRNER